jgi:ribosome-binding factor A
MGDEAKQRLSMRGLTSAAGFLQTMIAKRIDTRYTPKLQFVLDQGVKRSIEVSRILGELFPKGSPNDGDDVADDWEGGMDMEGPASGPDGATDKETQDGDP